MVTAMISIQLFASLKDAAGKSFIQFPLSNPMTIAEIYTSLQAMHPRLEPYRAVVLAAVNEEYASWETLVEPGDAVAFFPPVSGGGS